MFLRTLKSKQIGPYSRLLPRSYEMLKVHDAINSTLANIAVGRVSITLGWVAHAGTNYIMLKLAPKVSASYNFAAS